ncbi:MAG: pyrroline-5-carboxylate reductase [Phycisphaera sp.]|nr:pyrroline-5-carboxylate reductase [Phycisphaera sp.]
MAPRIVIVGFGNLGQAIARGAIASGLAAPSEIGALDPEPAQRARAEEHGLRLANPARIGESETVLLAVKPQSFQEAATALGTIPTDGPLVISVMAGVRSGAIRDALGGAARVVRAMPNTPAAVGRAVTAVASDADVAEDDLARVEQLFASVGKTVRVPEALFDAVTAVSGSGPAFVFRFLEAWTAAAESLGLSEEKAAVLARETLIGAAALLERTDDGPQVLRARVTSKGGTTAAGLARMDDAATRTGGIDALMLETLRAARDRGAELGRG